MPGRYEKMHCTMTNSVLNGNKCSSIRGKNEKENNLKIHVKIYPHTKKCYDKHILSTEQQYIWSRTRSNFECTEEKNWKV